MVVEVGCVLASLVESTRRRCFLSLSTDQSSHSAGRRGGGGQMTLIPSLSLEQGSRILVVETANLKIDMNQERR